MQMYLEVFQEGSISRDVNISIINAFMALLLVMKLNDKVTPAALTFLSVSLLSSGAILNLIGSNLDRYKEWRLKILFITRLAIVVSYSALLLGHDTEYVQILPDSTGIFARLGPTLYKVGSL